MMNIPKRFISVLLICSTLIAGPSAYAADDKKIEPKVVEDAFNFYIGKQRAAYDDGAGWDMEKFSAFTWADEDEEYLMGRLSQGLQKETYDDILLTDAAMLEEMNYVLDMRDEDEHSNSIGLMGGFIPSYVGKYYNAANEFVKLVQEQIGTKERPLFSNNVQYNVDLGYGAVPWATTMISWCAKQCDLSGGDKKVFGPPRALASDMFSDLTGNGFKWYANTQIQQWGGGGYRATPGDIIFWEDYKHVGVVTEVGNDYIVVVQGDVGPGIVSAITYKKPSMSLKMGKIVHVQYPNSVYSWDTLKAIVTAMKAQGFNSAAVAGIVGNLQAESGLVPYRCECDYDSGNNYYRSWAYTQAVDRGFMGTTKVPYSGQSASGAFVTEAASGTTVSKDDFINSGLFGSFEWDGSMYTPRGYGLAQFTSSDLKEILYDTAVKMGRSVGDAEVQMICILDKIQNKSVSKYGSIYGYDAITAEHWNYWGGGDSVSLYTLLKSVPDTEEGVLIACNAFLQYYEKPRYLKLDVRYGNAMARWEDIKTLFEDEKADASQETGGDHVQKVDRFTK